MQPEYRVRSHLKTSTLRSERSTGQPRKIPNRRLTKPPSDFHSLQAQELARLGERERAERLDNCERLFRAIVCSNHHLKRYEKWRCMQRFCTTCAARWSESLLKKLEHRLASLVERMPGRTFYLAVSVRCLRIESNQVKQFVERFGKTILKLSEENQFFGAQEGPVGFKEGRLTISAAVYCSGQLSEKKFRAIWPDAELHIVPLAKWHFGATLRKVLTVELPSTAEDRARLEAACARLHLGRTLGIFYAEVTRSAKVAEPTREPFCMESQAHTKRSGGFTKVRSRQGETRPCPQCGDTDELSTDWLPRDELTRFLTENGVFGEVLKASEETEAH